MSSGETPAARPRRSAPRGRGRGRVDARLGLGGCRRSASWSPMTRSGATPQAPWPGGKALRVWVTAATPPGYLAVVTETGLAASVIRSAGYRGVRSSRRASRSGRTVRGQSARTTAAPGSFGSSSSSGTATTHPATEPHPAISTTTAPPRRRAGRSARARRGDGRPDRERGPGVITATSLRAVSTVRHSPTALHHATLILHGFTALLGGTASRHCDTARYAVADLRHADTVLPSATNVSHCRPWRVAVPHPRGVAQWRIPVQPVR